MIRRLIILLLIVWLHAGDSDTLNTPKESYNFLSLGIGAATKNLNLIQISYNQKLNQNTSFYGLLGLPTLFGIGISWQQNYNNNGWMLSSGYGYNPFISGISGIDGDMCYLSIMYQWQLWNSRAYLSTGIQINVAEEFQSYIYNQNDEVMGRETAWEIMPYPIASVDWRLFSDKKKSQDKEGGLKLDKIIVILIVGVILLISMP